MTTPAAINVVTTINAGLVGAPDLTNALGQPFIAERASVHLWQPRRATVYVSGRAIRVDGSIGTSKRGRSYDLVGTTGNDAAPPWLADTLAGIGWRVGVDACSDCRAGTCRR